jgi:hypothetical protein
MIGPRKTNKASKDRFGGATDAEKVGYGQPPVASRFKPGKSGNPKGRPKRPGTYEEATIQELNTLMTVHEGGVARKMPKYQVLAKKTVNDAINGKSNAFKELRATLEKLAAAGLIETAEQIADRREKIAYLNDKIDQLAGGAAEAAYYRKWVGPFPARFILKFVNRPRNYEETAELEKRAALEPPLVLFAPDEGGSE